MYFREDINGLRAIAVVAVVLYHFNESWMPGGFAGVDVFFVISGFLMTGIIFRDMEKEQFSILEFYVARINRIVPALAILCVTLLVFGWFFLTPLDYKILGKHVGGSVGFFSNFLYWKESGYFDAASHEKWLLHTWSLSVEWQFYIIYPLVIVVASRFLSMSAMRVVVLVGAIAGFLICAFITPRWPDFSYYMLPARAWEMMLGGVAYLYPFKMKEKGRLLLEIFGVALIVSSYFLVSKESLWPGYLSIVPTMGAFLLIQAQREGSFLTGNFIFQRIGECSYSIYLWHWPFVVAIYYFSLSEGFVYLGIVFSMVFGFLSGNYVERISFRRDFKKPVQYFRCKPLYMVVIPFFLGAYVFFYLPVYYIYPSLKPVYGSFDRGEYECFDKEYQHKKNNQFCSLVAGGEKSFVFGDSHSYSSMPVFEAIARENGLELEYTGYSGCVPLLGVYPKRKDQMEKDCKALNDKVVDYVGVNDIKLVFLAARWTYYTSGDYSNDGVQFISRKSDGVFDKAESIRVFRWALKETFDKYEYLGVDVVLVLQVPMQEDKPSDIYYESLKAKKISLDLLSSASIERKKHVEFQSLTNDIILDEAGRYDNVYVIDPTGVFCNLYNCPVGNENLSYYFDDDHLSIGGSYKLRGAILEVLLKNSLLTSVES